MVYAKTKISPTETDPFDRDFKVRRNTLPANDVAEKERETSDIYPQAAYLSGFDSTRLSPRFLHAATPQFSSHYSLFKYDVLSLTTAHQSSMAKFIFSLGDENYRTLATEAKTRDITIQELIRAVIIPDWMRHNLDLRSLKDPTSILPHTTGFLNQRNGNLPSSIGRLKT